MTGILKYGLLGVFLLSAFYVGAQTPVVKEGFYPDGKLRYRGSFVGDQPQGEMKQFYPNGKVKAEMLHDGEHTTAILYSKEGEFRTSGKYVKKQKVGVWEYHAGERLIAKEEYVGGKLNGMTRKYDRNGNVVEEKQWKDGVANGKWTIFYDNGNLRFKVTFINGNLEGQLQSWHYNGQLSAQGDYKQNLKEGEWSYYNQEGKRTEIVNYVHGVADNSEKEVLEESRKIDMFIREGKRIADPADFTQDPEMYLRMVE